MKNTLILLALAAPLAACTKAPDTAATPFQVRYVTALAPGQAARETGAAFLGFIRGDTETSLSFQVNGPILRIGPAEGDDWKEGTHVEAGAVLAQVDTANFVSAVASARAQAELARATFLRNSELYAAASISKNDFEASRAQMETAAAHLAQAEQNLRDTTLRAPYSGIILSRSARSGEYAAAGRAVLRLGDFRRASIEVGVPDTLLGDLAVGRAYAVRVSAFEGASFAGTISEIGTAASDDNRLFRVVLKLDNADGRLKSGMTASVRLGGTAVNARHGVLIPLSALVATDRSGPNSAVFIIGPDGHAHERVIRTGDIVASSIHVTRGIAAGDRVVTQGAGQLFDGAPVQAKAALR